EIPPLRNLLQRLVPAFASSHPKPGQNDIHGQVRNASAPKQWLGPGEPGGAKRNAMTNTRPSPPAKPHPANPPAGDQECPPETIFPVSESDCRRPANARRARAGVADDWRAASR